MRRITSGTQARGQSRIVSHKIYTSNICPNFYIGVNYQASQPATTTAIPLPYFHMLSRGNHIKFQDLCSNRCIKICNQAKAHNTLLPQSSHPKTTSHRDLSRILTIIQRAKKRPIKCESMLFVEACSRNTSKARTGFHAPEPPDKNGLAVVLVRVFANNMPTEACRPSTAAPSPMTAITMIWESELTTYTFQEGIVLLDAPEATCKLYSCVQHIWHKTWLAHTKIAGIFKNLIS